VKQTELFSLIDLECRDVHGNHCHLSCKPNFGWQRAWPDTRTPRMNSQARYIRQLKAPIEQQVRTLAKYQGLKLIQCGARGDEPTYNLVKNKKRVHVALTIEEARAAVLGSVTDTPQQPDTPNTPALRDPAARSEMNST
jgi:hypothetical protein